MKLSLKGLILDEAPSIFLLVLGLIVDHRQEVIFAELSRERPHLLLNLFLDSQVPLRF